MARSYLIVGSGRQGQSVAYNLLTHSTASRITFADNNREQALKAAEWLKKFIPKGEKTRIGCMIIENLEDLKRKNIGLYFHTMVAALPHELVLEALKIAIAERMNYFDFGFDPQIIRKQLELSDEAKKVGIKALINNGIGPGANNTIAVGGSREYDCDTIEMILGGVPTNPNCNPIGYESAFANLLCEYVGSAKVMENGKLKTVKLPSGLQKVEITGINYPLEAFFTDVASEFAAEIMLREGKIKNFWEKTARWEGHFELLKALDEIGLFEKNRTIRLTDELTPIEVVKSYSFGPKISALPEEMRNKIEFLFGSKKEIDGSRFLRTSPFEVSRQCFDAIPRVKEDLMIFQILFKKDEKEVARVEMVEHFDAKTKRTAMKTSTSGAMAAAILLAESNTVPAGVWLPEQILPWRELVAGMQDVGLPIEIKEART